MKISAIATSGFIGARDVDIRLHRPITLICGHNHSGKSSLSEAVRMALTGESVRVSLKKDYPRLITEGQSVGFAVVDHDAGRSTITLPSGAHEHTGQARPPAVLPYVMDAQRFARLDVNERRQFLFGLMGLKTDGPAVASRLAAKGCDPDKIEQIAPFLRSGFDAAHKESKDRARESKAAWRTVTGEVYGSLKADGWKANKPAHDVNRLRMARDELARVDEQIERGVAELAVMQSAATRQAQQSEKVAGLRERAMQFARISAKLRKDEEELKEWQDKVDQEEILAKQAQASSTSGKTYTCPACSATLTHDLAKGVLVEFTQLPQPVTQPSEPSRLFEYQRARDLLSRSVENDKRDLAAADAAARALAEIEDARSDPAPSTEEIDARKAQVAEARKEQTRLAGVIKALEADERAADVADEKTEMAIHHHKDLAQWLAIADALAPSGIPCEMLAAALEPINERLARSAAETEWLRVRVDAEMAITGDGRPYALLSESERWRSDATIAEAISHISGVKLMVLDRVDVLDLAGRDDLLYWLDGLVVSGEIETALLFATLKTLPDGLPETVGSVWIENGTAKNTQDAS